MTKYKCIIDRPIGYKDKFNNIYPINYGYIEGIIAPDGEEQDVYIIDEDKPLNTYEGLVAKIIRKDDVEDKWILSKRKVSKEEIIEKTLFMEQYFKSTVIMIEE